MTICSSLYVALSNAVAAGGNRIAKHIYTAEGVYKKSTFYVRDASGNVMATYSAEVNTQEATETYKLIERPLYGSSRVGMLDSSWHLPEQRLRDDNPVRNETGDVTEVEWIVATDGMGQPMIEVAPPVTANTYTRELGHKQYEMSNHLGNCASR